MKGSGFQKRAKIFLKYRENIAARVTALPGGSAVPPLFVFFERTIPMTNKNSVRIRKTVITALCVALCIVLPMAFHMVKNAGTIFLPMHIPVLLCGLICGWQYGLVCGLLGPLLSSLLTQMPPMAILPSMMAELAVYGAVTGLMMYAFKYKTTYLSLYTSLVVALISGRVVSGILKALIFSAGNYSFSVWVTASFVTCLPGLAIQLVIIPTLVKVLAKAKLLPCRQAQKQA